jgi:hypothetical protein
LYGGWLPYREGENANGYWLDGKFELVVLPLVSSVGVVAPTLITPILPTPVLKARINEFFQNDMLVSHSLEFTPSHNSSPGEFTNVNETC